MAFDTVNPNKILLSNQGYMKIYDEGGFGVEIAELKELAISVIPEMKEIVVLNSETKGKIITSISGSITFELNKIYSRFKPSVLECYKYCQPFYFSLEATVKAPKRHNKHREEESIFIGICWLEGEIPLLALKSDAELLTEKYTAGFVVKSADFLETIDDGYSDWESLSFQTKNPSAPPPAINHPHAINE